MAPTNQIYRIKSINLQGYRPFRSLSTPLGPLEVVVGANGSGKSALLEFLRFLRDSMSQEIPSGIVPDSAGKQIFHMAGSDKFSWTITFNTPDNHTLWYQGTVLGPVGKIRTTDEIVELQTSSASTRLLGLSDNNLIRIREPSNSEERNYPSTKANQLLLGTVFDAGITTVYNLRQFIANWGFYSGFNINTQEMRRPILIDQEPTLHEDASNLGAVLNYLYTEHRPAFDALQQFLRSIVPSFKSINVRARGGPGQVMTFWSENNVAGELSLADLSEGILRLLCWGVLCVHPKPPSLICIDEPELGVHPRTLPFLAGLLKKASNHTQILVTTHSSYFLTQFDLPNIGVMHKQDGGAQFTKPQDSKVLAGMLTDFGPEEIEILHRSDELEHLA